MTLDFIHLLISKKKPLCLIRCYIYCLQVVGKVPSQKTMGLGFDDPSKPKDVVEVAKIFLGMALTSTSMVTGA